MNRSSWLVRLGRVYQILSPSLVWIDKMAFKCLKSNDNKEPTIICLLGAPRSGTTLTYQIMNTGLKGMHLNNFWNLCYATPYIGGIIAKKIMNKRVPHYVSKEGFVSGIGGEAEGLKFWKKWIGVGLIEREVQWEDENSYYLKKVFSELLSSTEVMITGFLGHVFSIDEFRVLFPNTIFVHLYRDLLSNAHSIYMVSPDEWISSRPLNNEKNDSLNRYAQISSQLLNIHRRIWQSTRGIALRVSIEDISQNPLNFIHSLANKANELGVVLNMNASIMTLESEIFNVKRVERDTSQVSNELYLALRNDIDKLEDDDFKRFLSLMIE